MKKYYLEKVDNKKYSIYHTIYTREDINFWFNWEIRLDETNTYENCYFVYIEDICVGGVIIENNEVSNSFLIPPYNDREMFWNIIIDYIKNNLNFENINFLELHSKDTEKLLRLDANIQEQKNYMCRPTEKMDFNVNDNFILENVKECDYEELAVVQLKSYGKSDISEYTDLKKYELVSCFKEDINEFIQTNSYNMTSLVREKSTNKIVGGCISGRYDIAPNMFGCIFELYVLPDYRKLGLGRAMVQNALSADYINTPVIKLHSFIKDKPAINLYNKLGFISGGIFTDLNLCLNNKTSN